MQFRIGHGYDAHKFVAGKPLVLGGVKVSFDKGLEAHSDGDLVIHALCDALLGAACLGDMGRHFPSSDVMLLNVDSRVLLQKVMEMLKEKNYKVSNVDITVLAEEPKLAPYIQPMRKNLADDLFVDIEQINIKATTTEKMGFVGRGEGLAAYAVVLVSMS